MPDLDLNLERYRGVLLQGGTPLPPIHIGIEAKKLLCLTPRTLPAICAEGCDTRYHRDIGGYWVLGEGHGDNRSRQA